MKYTYLLIDLFSVLVPFIFSFHHKLRFYKHWLALFPAIIITGIIFLGWDVYFTYLKIWGFNSVYLIGYHIANLPVEEVLFFGCIPYACIFTFTCLNTLIRLNTYKRTEIWISCLLIVMSCSLAINLHAHSYTCYTFTLLAVLLFTTQFILKASWLLKFYISYLVLLVPFLIVNGLLTGTGLDTPVVWYNPAFIINVRILTIPVEDIFYGMDLILLNVMIYSWISTKINRIQKYRNKADTHVQLEPVYTKSNIHS